MKIAVLLLATVMILLFIGGAVMLNEVICLYTLTNRVEGKVIAAGWSAFPEIDFDTLAKRHNMANEENRDIYLNKNESENSIRYYIKKNLGLDDLYYPTDDSFLSLNTYPVIVDEIDIYNPSDVPVVTPEGVTVNRTAVYISIQFPIRIKFVGDCYKRVVVVVDTESFYSQAQGG